MKILITGTTGESMPPPYGGVPKLSLLVAREWKRLGHSVSITFVYRPAKADDLNAGATYFFQYGGKPTKIRKIAFLARYFLKNPVLFSSLFRNHWAIYPHDLLGVLLYSAYGVYMDGVITSVTPDIILSEAALIQTYMVAEVARRRFVPIVFDTYAEIHDLTSEPNRNLSDAERGAYWKSFLSLANLIIAPGPYCCRGPLAYVSQDKVSYVYDGSDYTIADMNIEENKETLRSALNLPKDLFLVGNVGSFEARKGHDYLIKAVAKLKREGHPIGAAICGGSGDSAKWRALAESEGVADRVFLFGRLSERDLGRVLKSLDCFSDLENTPRACGFTMSILEGMSMRLPVVIFENREMLEIVHEGETGFVVPINDTDALASAILKMQRLPENTRLSMGQNAANAVRRFDIAYTAEEKLKLFEETLRAYAPTI